MSQCPSPSGPGVSQVGWLPRQPALGWFVETRSERCQSPKPNHSTGESSARAHTRALGEKTKVKGARDGTVYGLSATAPRSFYSHHLRMISLAIATAVAQSIADWGDAAASSLVDHDASAGGSA